MKTFGYDIKAWLAAKQQARAVMIERASARAEKVVEYARLVGRISAISGLDPHSYALRELLDQISREEDAAGRGMLTAVVVNKETGRPGRGFFTTARALGRVATSDEELWANEFRRVRMAWATKKENAQ